MTQKTHSCPEALVPKRHIPLLLSFSWVMAGIMAPTDSNKGVDNGEGIVHVEVENAIIDLAATFQIQLHKYE